MEAKHGTSEKMENEATEEILNFDIILKIFGLGNRLIVWFTIVTLFF
jgi:hypothetical protein